MSGSPLIFRLPIFPSPDAVIRTIGRNSPAFYLDSSDLGHSSNRYSYAGIRPSQVLSGSDNPWPKLEDWTRSQSPSGGSDFFSGGLVGYLAYENYRFLSPYEWISASQGPIPDYWFGWFESVLVLDHRRKECFLASDCLHQNHLEEAAGEWMRLFGQPVPEQPGLTAQAGLMLGPDKAVYSGKIRKIQEYLKAGDAYQMNLTERFRAESEEPAERIYARLRELSPAPFSAFLNAEGFQILSASPECLLEVRAGRIATYPIKGTRRRAEDLQQDHLAVQELTRSEKDRAELLMIVDLERNDLGRVCEFGSVEVMPLFAVESFAQVHHLVARVSGKLKPGCNALDGLKALFPGGSVTGAPKLRAMEMIHELELCPRSVYTGALGYLGLNGQSQFNLPIRTLTKVGGALYFHAGCGITIDSDPEAEFDELMAKAEGILRAIQ